MGFGTFYGDITAHVAYIYFVLPKNNFYLFEVEDIANMFSNRRKYLTLQYKEIKKFYVDKILHLIFF